MKWFQARLCGAAVLATTLLLAGCSSVGLTTDKIDYGRAVSPKTLDVPPELSQLPRDDRFAVPERGSATASATVGARAAAQPGAVAVVAPASPNARIERAGSQRWLVVNVAPEQAFTVIREFLPTLGLAIAREDAKVGIVETAWAENRAKLPQDIIRRTLGRVLDNVYSTGEQDKYRVRIERAANNTAEIFVSHRGMIEVFTSSANDRTMWQPRPSDPDMEAELLQRLALRFSPAEQSAASAGAAASPTAAVATGAAAEVARLLPADATKSARVQIDEPFDRAWRRVGLALDRGGFTVEDRDRTRGLYFVRYLDPEYEQKQRDKQGFFSRLFGADAKIEAQQFRVFVATAGERAEVTVQDRDGKPDTSATGAKILGQINQQLK